MTEDKPDMTGKTITLKADKPAYGGLCIGRHGGRVVMIKGALPGETVEARIDEDKKSYCKAAVTAVTRPSPDRVKPPCPYFGECGGCQLQYASYERQVAMKQEVLADCMQRIAKQDAELSEPLTGEPWGYRLRGRFKAGPGGMGFYREKTREVVDIERCMLMSDDVNLYLARARAAMHGAEITGLSITCTTDGATALVRAGRGAGKGAGKGIKALAHRLLDAGFAGVCMKRPGSRPVSFGAGHVTFSFCGLTYTASPGSFIQANLGQSGEAAELVAGPLGPLAGKRVLDLYAGAGNFALPLAREGADVVAVEENPSSVADGRRNARLNGIMGCGFVRTSVEELRARGGFDALVMDPPRTGLSKAALDKVLDIAAVKIAYVSCNPSTFARDVKRLSAKYDVGPVRLMDFFPQTYHIECLGIFSLR